MPALGNPTHEIFALESAAGMEPDDAALIAGLAFEPERPTEPPQRRSRIARQCLGTIDRRIELLELLGTAEARRAGFRLRNDRAIAELRWCRAVIANGGVEPEEWFEDGDVEQEGGAAS